jgi:hypothetical protein
MHGKLNGQNLQLYCRAFIFITSTVRVFAAFLLSRLHLPGSLSMAGEFNLCNCTFRTAGQTPQPATHPYVQYTAISSQQEEKRIRTSNPQHRQALITSSFLPDLFTPWSRVLPEKLTGLQPVKKFPSLMEPERSIPHSQGPATCPCPESDQSRRCPHIPLPEDLS